MADIAPALRLREFILATALIATNVFSKQNVVMILRTVTWN